MYDCDESKYMCDDVNERVREEWKSDTIPRERVRTVMRRTYDPNSASTIAEHALVDEGLCRSYLDLLADDGFVEVKEDGGETHYRRAPDSVIRERVEQILDTVDVETLERRVGEMREAVGDDASETQRRNLMFAEAALEIADDGE